MHRLKPLVLIPLVLMCGGLAACSGEAPFIETFPADIRKHSAVAICHDQDATQQQIDARAAEACAGIDKLPELSGTQKFQCRLLAPHRTWYRCVAKPKE